MKIGIFGGAFNPVHNGHINLADIYFEALGLDKLIFIPTYKPPHKTDEAFADGQDRVNMLTLAIDNPDYEISTLEFDREGLSYTYDTLVELKKSYPDDSLYLIIGEDQFMSFNRWYRWEDILDMVTLCTFPRTNDNEHITAMKRASILYGADKCIMLDSQPVELSSSEIRKRLKDGGSVSGLIPAGVEKYIKEKGLYI